MELSMAMEGMAKGALGAADDRVLTFGVSQRNGVECRKMLDITRDKPIKLAVRVAVPVRDHPKFNFVGKLLGPKGNSMKRLQEETMCKMAVLGRGSMKDRQKEEEYRLSGDHRYSHLSEDLHVEISAFAAPAEAHARIAYALAEVRRFLVPDYHDDIRQEQMWEMHALCTQPPGEEPPLGPDIQSDLASDAPREVTPGAEHPHPATMQTGSQEHLLQSVGDGGGLPLSIVPLPDRQTDGEVICVGQGGATHPALRGVKIGNGAGTLARKRPLLGGPRAAMSPTKRTVMSLLARARQAQALHTQRHSELLLREVAPPLSMMATGLVSASAEGVLKMASDMA